MQDDNLTAAGKILKNATRALFKTGFSSPDYAVDHCRVGRSVLFDYQNPGKSDLFMPVDIAASLQQACGQYPVTLALARLSDGYFVRPSRGNTRLLFGGAMAEVGRDVGTLVRDAYAVAAGERLSDKDVATLKGDIEQAVADLLSALGALEGARG